MRNQLKTNGAGSKTYGKVRYESNWIFIEDSGRHYSTAILEKSCPVASARYSDAHPYAIPGTGIELGVG